VPRVDWFARNKALLEGGTRDAGRFRSLDVKQGTVLPVKREYSITADILAFRRCSRQYGYFSVLHFVPAQVTQIYYGSVIHEVLDRAHRQFAGKMEGYDRGIPTDLNIERHFNAVSTAMRSKRITPFGKKGEEAAKRAILNFNRAMGPVLYPRVRDTEHKLKIDMKDFLLVGVVDVLVGDGAASDSDEVEIWDYKGSKRLEPGSKEIAQYEFQMQVYAELYNRKNGRYPAKSILCFLEEHDPKDMIVEVPFNAASVSEAMKEFARTVAEIERRSDTGDWGPPKDPPSRQTCAACDLRWDCPSPKERFGPTFP
jgi:DNA helicase II / ATP-dependent DNA helicase PcrA